MKLRRGCGCPILILALADLLYLVAGVVSLIQHSVSRWGALLIMFIALANGVVCVIVALAAIRGETLSGPMRTLTEGEDIEGGEEDVDGTRPPTGEAPE